MKKNLFVKFVFLFALLLTFSCPALAAEPEFVAVAFTGPNYSGVSWVIPAEGSYDLRNGFGLPNDSICSIRVRPGYTVMLYQHSEFGGERVDMTEDSPNLAGNERWASSLKVTRSSEKSVPASWERNASRTAALDEVSGGDAEAIWGFQNKIEPNWYGTTTDAERIEMGGQLLVIFRDMGLDIDGWKPDSFAQQVNNFFDWRKDKTVWEIACMVMNVKYVE